MIYDISVFFRMQFLETNLRPKCVGLGPGPGPGHRPGPGPGGSNPSNSGPGPGSGRARPLGSGLLGPLPLVFRRVERSPVASARPQLSCSPCFVRVRRASWVHRGPIQLSWGAARPGKAKKFLEIRSKSWFLTFFNTISYFLHGMRANSGLLASRRGFSQQ